MKTRILILIFIVISVFLLSSLNTPVLAAKKRIWSSTPIVGISGPSVSATLTGWKQYLNLSFRGLANTNGLSYELIFSGNNLDQGIYDTIKPSGGNITRSLFLGTCSHGACTPYKNINNLRLTVTYKMKNGQTVVKKYKVKY